MTTRPAPTAGPRRLHDVAAALPVLVAAIAIGWLARWGPDWPAQEFRAWTAQHFGLTAWSNYWYSGLALPGYSVLYPPIAAVLGAALTGVLAVLAGTLGAAAFVPRGSRLRSVGFRVSVGFLLVADLLIGQVPYLLGVAFGVNALVAVRARRPWLATFLAVGCSLASPLAGAFLLIAVPAVAAAVGRRRALPLAGAGAGVLASVLVSGAGGPFPFHWHTAASASAFVVLGLALTGRRDRPVQVFLVTFGVAALAAGLVPNPIGGNIVRLSQLTALPLFWLVLPRLRVGHRVVAVLVAIAAAVWPATPSLSSISRGAEDPSRTPSFYSGLLGFLHTRSPAAGRLEVVFTREHWESLWVAKSFPIARGWERQTDLDVNSVLYGRLTASGYRRWLDDNAVSLVALPRAPIDFGGQAEATLLRRPPGYLVPVWHDADWQVWRVRDAQPLVSGAASLSDLGPASFVLDFAAAGRATVRIRASDMWEVTAGEACVSATPAGWLRIAAPASGLVTVRSRVEVTALDGDAASRCS